MNEELEQFIQEVKSTLPWLLAAAIAVGGYYGVKKYVADRRAAASEAVADAGTTDEIEDAAAKYKGAKVSGVLNLRLAKSYFDAGNYEGALEVYTSLEGQAPDGFAGVPAVGKAQCLEALGKFDDAAKAFDAFAEANPASYLALTAKLGAARCIAQSGDREKAIARLEEIKGTLDDEVGKARVDATIDLVKRYEKRAERSLFEAAEAAQKQIEAEAAQQQVAEKAEEPKKDAPKAEEPKPEPVKAE